MCFEIIKSKYKNGSRSRPFILKSKPSRLIPVCRSFSGLLQEDSAEQQEVHVCGKPGM